jgi:hypothetical protein
MKFFSLLMSLIVLNGAEASAACLSYNNEVTLSGKVTTTIFPGPPNYTDIKQGDRAEHDLFRG